MTDTKRTVVAHIPRGISLDLLGAVGGLLDAALGGALLMSGQHGSDGAGSVVLRDDQDQADAVRLLNAARRRIARRPLKPAPEDEPTDDPSTLNRISEHPDGGLEFGLGGSLDAAQEMARMMLAAFIPALRDTDAVNYLEFPATDQDTGQTYALIVVKPDGLTPHAARQRAEREADRLRALLAEHGIEDPHA
ncbi:hypothetical protein [Kibdelosporangium phytohabitans]|uniref:Uncharacterized protein n=1 Tax=Kibdelosporangium phytohabitans TaxID=860235 RepID=A0A0N7F350_9PSEU|nr:hypothetical protein [Kibdelosporangium phytohabitans]ALG07647.1 hypothetical protein AOZ06_12670 [Kibdelosporangium phytohabitans]ALG07703.1 hypothetical protein AOZ06_12990 [Kibdelosporangium phytohabitans]MBE1471399.1 hypothetical protein [Kibdelosporangium phytohabitans]